MSLNAAERGQIKKTRLSNCNTYGKNNQKSVTNNSGAAAVKTAEGSSSSRSASQIMPMPPRASPNQPHQVNKQERLRTNTMSDSDRVKLGNDSAQKNSQSSAQNSRATSSSQPMPSSLSTSFKQKLVNTVSCVRSQRNSDIYTSCGSSSISNSLSDFSNQSPATAAHNSNIKQNDPFQHCIEPGENSQHSDKNNARQQRNRTIHDEDDEYDGFLRVPAEAEAIATREDIGAFEARQAHYQQQLSQNGEQRNKNSGHNTSGNSVAKKSSISCSTEVPSRKMMGAQKRRGVGHENNNSVAPSTNRPSTVNSIRPALSEEQRCEMLERAQDIADARALTVRRRCGRVNSIDDSSSDDD